jgi:hypothetical protein
VNKGSAVPSRIAIATILALSTLALAAAAQVKPTVVVKNGYEFEIRSDTKIMLDQLNSSGRVIPLDEPADGPDDHDGGGLQFRRGNIQVNNPLFDSIQIFPGFRPFVHSTQSETSVATFGRTIVATYNTSAGMHLIPNPSGPGLVFDRIQLSGFSTSTDGGKSFISGFFPGVQGIPFSFGDPSIDVDRRGNFYYAQLGQDVDGTGAITVNSSADGVNWNNAVVAALDDNSDKEWIAVGPDPFHRKQDNVYVTWSSFQSTGVELRFAKSTDGGVTWTSKTVYAPTADPDPTHPQNSVSFTNPVVDRSTGRLYIPFAHFSNADTDFIQMLVSDDAGTTFQFANFNVPGAPDSTLLPIVQPGELIECGATLVAPKTFAINLRLTLHAGADVGGSITGLRRFVHATRLIAQPAIAVRDGVVYLAWNTSTSPFFGDPNGTSKIMFMRSNDGGGHWDEPVQVSTPGDPHHVHPSLSISGDGQDEEGGGQVHVSYYTQHSDGSLDLVMSTSENGGKSFRADRTIEISSAPFALPPTNIPIPSKANPFAVTNYDRTIQPCYAIGEYQSVKSTQGLVYVLWGDTRTTITEPVNALDPLSGLTHPQEDVFFQLLREKD